MSDPLLPGFNTVGDTGAFRVGRDGQFLACIDARLPSSPFEHVGGCLVLPRLMLPSPVGPVFSGTSASAGCGHCGGEEAT